MADNDSVRAEATGDPPNLLKSPLPTDDGWRRHWEERLTAAGISTAVDTSRPQLLAVLLIDYFFAQADLAQLRALAGRLRIPPRQAKTQGTARRWVLDHWHQPTVRQVATQAFAQSLRNKAMRAPGVTAAQVTDHLDYLRTKGVTGATFWLNLAWNALHAADPAAACALFREVLGPAVWDAHEAALQEQVEPYLWRVQMAPHIRQLDEAHHGAGALKTLAGRVEELLGETSDRQARHQRATNRLRELERLLADLDTAVRAKAREVAAARSLRQDLTGLLLDNMAAERRAWLEGVAASRARPGAPPSAPGLPLAGRQVQIVADATAAMVAGTLARFLGASGVSVAGEQAAAGDLGTQAASRVSDPDLIVVVSPATVPPGLRMNRQAQVVTIGIPGLLAIWTALQSLARREESP